MPCYDPPPPWKGAQKKNAEQAVKLLCAEVKAQLNAGKTAIPPTLLRWYMEHRQIDRQIATTPYYGKADPAEAAQAERDIAHAKQLLGA